MTKIGAISPVKKYLGNGTTKNFPFTFMYWDDSEINVYINETLQTTGYTISSSDKTAGGTIIFNTAPANNANITINRLVDVKRYSEFEESGTFKAAVINDELNRIVAEIQQVSEEISRCLKSGLTDNLTPEEYLNLIYINLDNKVAAAASSASNAASSATSASNSKTAAANSASAAANSASSALSSKNAAANSASAAATSKNQIDTVLETSGFNTVKANLDEINTVAGNIGNVNAVGSAAGAITAINSKISMLQTLAERLYVLIRVYDNINSIINTAANIGDIMKVSALFDNNSTLIFGGFAATQNYGDSYHGGTATAAASEYGETISGSDALQDGLITYFEVFQTCANNLITFQNAPTYATQAANAAQSANEALETITETLAVIHGGTASSFN